MSSFRPGFNIQKALRTVVDGLDKRTATPTLLWWRLPDKDAYEE